MVVKIAKDTKQLLRHLKDGTPMDPDAGRSQSCQIAVKLKKFDFTDNSYIKAFLGAETQRALDGIHLLQSHLL